MKKIFQYSFAALVGLVLASCTSDYTDWASPQTNPAENPAEKYGVTFVAGEDANIVMPVRNDDVKLVALNAASDKVADFAVTGLTINGEAIDATVEKGSIVVSATDLNEMIQRQYNSRASVARTLDVESTVSLILSNGDAVTADVKGTTTATFTAKPTPAIDAKGYYILGNFDENGNGWDLSTPIWMEKVSDGVYSAIVTLSGDGDAWYKFYEGSHYENGNWDEANKGEMGCATNGDKTMENFLVYKGDDQAVQTPVISGDKGNIYKVTLDMNNLTYKVVRQAVNYYIVGGPNDWAGSCATKQLKFNQANIDVPVYNIIFPAAAEGDTWFAIGDDKACDAIVNENNDAAWKLLYGTTNGNGLSGASGTLTRRINLSDDGSFKVEAGAAFIQVTINMKDMTYEITPISIAAQCYVVGGVQGWSDKDKTCLFTPEEGKNILSYTTKWTGAWDLKIWDADNFGNWGAAWGCAVDGDNSPSGALQNTEAQAISAPSGEFYTFTIDMNTMTYTWTRLENQTPTEYENISLIGEFNGWDGDFDLSQVTPHNWYGVFTQKNDGQLKFRANHAWSVNWGYGSDKDWNVAIEFNKIGTNGGGNIWVPAGTYAVYLNDITNSMMMVAQ